MRRPHHYLPYIRLRYVALALALFVAGCWVAHLLGYDPPAPTERAARGGR